ncbi:MAG: phenylalanine--tRNA ligase subunit alpha [Patescibacteria group bacterium]
MSEAISALSDPARREISQAKTISELKTVENKWLGRDSKLRSILSELVSRPPEERRTIGKAANELRNEIKQVIQDREAQLTVAKPLTEAFDPTISSSDDKFGHLHPIEQFMRKVEDIFLSMGFSVIEGPEVEQPRYSFDLLNIPKNHPARDVWDTFYIKGPGNLLLRPHTSPMQIRAMEKLKSPVRLIVPGRVYRHEATDASHEAMFYQCEGLVIDEGIKITDLIGTLVDFAKEIFGRSLKYRLRPHYYPFVEPGMDFDLECVICHGQGCRVCGKTGWLEMLGSGMVHPKVLRNMKVDPKKYNGYAFGLGIDRWMMLYYGINDIRLSYSGNLNFLKQF